MGRVDKIDWQKHQTDPTQGSLSIFEQVINAHIAPQTPVNPKIKARQVGSRQGDGGGIEKQLQFLRVHRKTKPHQESQVVR